MNEEELRQQLAELTYDLHSKVAHYPRGSRDQIRRLHASVKSTFEQLNKIWLAQAASQTLRKRA